MVASIAKELRTLNWVALANSMLSGPSKHKRVSLPIFRALLTIEGRFLIM